METVTIPQALAFDLLAYLCPADTKAKAKAYQGLLYAIEIESVDAFLTYCETKELRNVEVWESEPGDYDVEGNPLALGWYYWYGVPGCLPESEPYGPYLSEQGATVAAYSNQYEGEV